MTRYGADHQPRTVLHQDAPVVAQDGRTLPALLEQTCIRIRTRLMRLLAASLALPARVGIASAACRRTIVRAVLRTEAFVTGPCLNQRAVHREMVSGQQAPLVGQTHDFGEERFYDIMFQQRIADRIIQAQADYVLTVKDNQPALARLVRGIFDALERWPVLYAGTFDEYREIDEDHGRIETRRCVAQDISSRWPGKVHGRWPGLRSVITIEATREIAGVASTQRRYYISSRPSDACRIAHAVRSHWRIPKGTSCCASQTTCTGCSTWCLAKTRAA